MATVSTLVNLFGISKHTVRTWSTEFSDYMSDGACPPSGERRRYSDRDIGVFALIHHLRGQNARYPEIHDALSRGERMDVTPNNMEIMLAGTNRSGGGTASAPPAGYAPVELIESFAQRLTVQFQEQINQLRDQIDRLDKQNNYFRDKFEETLKEVRGAQERVLEAEKTIARLETELKGAEQNQQLLKEERAARMNAQNRLMAAQAKVERMEAELEGSEQKGRQGLFTRR
jgi:DNA-binding transcriptional MerR regulator